MQGQFAFNGAGYTQWVGCPISMMMGTLAFTGLGGLYSQPGNMIQPSHTSEGVHMGGDVLPVFLT